jgi:hypothetical protein
VGERGLGHHARLRERARISRQNTAVVAIDELLLGSHFLAMVSATFPQLAMSERLALGTPPFLMAALVVILLFSTCRCGIPMKWSKWPSSSHERLVNWLHAFEALFGALSICMMYSDDFGGSMLFWAILGVSFFGLSTLLRIHDRNQQLRPLVRRATYLTLFLLVLIIFGIMFPRVDT